MAQVVDRWHLANPGEGFEICREHSTKTRRLVASAGHGNGKRWQVRYRDAGGKQKKENFARRGEADARAAQVETDLNRGQFVDPMEQRITFREYAERWRLMQPHRGSTAANVERCLRLHAYPVFGDRRLVSIRPSEIQAWVTGLVEVRGFTAQTARNSAAKVKQVFNAAVRDGIVQRSPCAGVKLPSVPHVEIVPLAAGQVSDLASAVPHRYRALVILGASTGLRPGELFGLQVKHIDFSRRMVKVEQQLQRVPGGKGVHVCPPKTRRSHRRVPLPRIAATSLKEHLDNFPAHGEEFLFRNEKGEPIHSSRFYEQTWRPAIAKVKLPKGTGPHALRHTYASLLIAAGESVKVVSERLGHTNAAMTLNVYSHLFPESEVRTRAAVDRAFGVVTEECAPDVPSQSED